MMKQWLYRISSTLLVFCMPSYNAYACSNLFVNSPGYYVEARTLDFPIKLYSQNYRAYQWYNKLTDSKLDLDQIVQNAFSYYTGYIGVGNMTNVVVSADKIPRSQLTTWKNKYGYFGRKGFIGDTLSDGMNTEGLSVSALYLPGTIYPSFDEKDKRSVLSIYDTSNYLLAMAKDVPEAMMLLKKHQLVESAMELFSGVFLKDIPLHLSIRDAKGNSAVVEYLDGKVVFYQKAQNILTNAPNYDWQLNNAKRYQSLKDTNEQENPLFENRVINYEKIYQVSKLEDSGLLGLPGDFTSASRFVRGAVFLDNVSTPSSISEALYQADSILENLTVPLYESSATMWKVIKDLGNRKLYYKDVLVYKNKKIMPASMARQYKIYNLREIDFQNIPIGSEDSGLSARNPEQVTAVYSIKYIPGLNYEKR